MLTVPPVVPTPSCHVSPITIKPHTKKKIRNVTILLTTGEVKVYPRTGHEGPKDE